MFLHVSINFKKESLNLGLKSYHILSFDPLTQFNGKLCVSNILMKHVVT